MEILRAGGLLPKVFFLKDNICSAVILPGIYHKTALTTFPAGNKSMECYFPEFNHNATRNPRGGAPIKENQPTSEITSPQMNAFHLRTRPRPAPPPPLTVVPVSAVAY